MTPDNSKLAEFLQSYPYGHERKILILELIEQHHPLLENGYTKIVETNNSRIDFKVWAFGIIDKVLDKIQDMPISDNAKQDIDPIIQSVIDELAQN